VVDGSTISISSSTFSGFRSIKQGGLFYLSESTMVMDGSTIDEVYEITYGAVFYLYTSSELTCTSSTFSNIYDFQSGGLVMLEFAKVTLTSITVDTVYISDEEDQSGSAGGVIMVVTYDSTKEEQSGFDEKEITISSSTFKDIYDIESGAFAYIQGYDLTLTSNSFEGISTTTSGTGAILYIYDYSGTSYSFTSNTFTDISSYQYAILDMSDCDASETRSFYYNSFEDITSLGSTAFGLFSATDCAFTFISNDFLDIHSSYADANDLGEDSAIKIEDASSVTMTSNSIKYVTTEENDYETFLEIEGDSVLADVTFASNTIYCQEQYQDSTDANMTAVIYLSSLNSFTSASNTVKYCNTGYYGVYYMSSVTSISDTGSTYQNNSASTGGVYYIISSSVTQSTISI